MTQAGAGKAVTALRIEGVAPSVAHRVATLEGLLKTERLGKLDEAASRSFWKAVRDVTALAADDHPLWRISTAPMRGHEIAAAIGEGTYYYDWAGGLIWLALPPSDDGGARACAVRPPGSVATRPWSARRRRCAVRAGVRTAGRRRRRLDPPYQGEFRPEGRAQRRPHVGGGLSMTSGLAEIARALATGDPGTKPLAYYEIYGRYFEGFANRPVTMLELGVYPGELTRVFASYFKSGTVIGVDSEDRRIDFSAHPNVVFALADQRRADQLAAICDRHAPRGLDIVIDDAAHIGSWSLAAYRTLLPLLNPGGIYVAEDWGTGYWDDWPDGHRFRPSRFLRWSKRIRSHDHGMVGFLKSLIDDVSVDVAPTRAAPRTQAAQFEFMHVYAGTAVLKKLGMPQATRSG